MWSPHGLDSFRNDYNVIRSNSVTANAMMLKTFAVLQGQGHWEPCTKKEVLSGWFSTFQSYRLLLKAGCRWYGICAFWVENLLFEVIL